MDTTCTFADCNRQAARKAEFKRPCGHGGRKASADRQPVCAGCLEGRHGPAPKPSPCPTCGDLNSPHLIP